MSDPALFDRPELAPLWTELARRYEAGGEVRTVRLSGLTEPQRGALADLLGLARRPGQRATVAVVRVDDAVGRVLGYGTRDLVEALRGPLRDRPAERDAAVAARARLWDGLSAHPVVAALPALQSWVDGLRRAGLIDGSVPATRVHTHRALAVLAALPAAGEPLPVLAERVLDDPHALDEGTRLGGTVLRGLAALHDQPPPADAGARRELWATHGVADDELSAVVLVAGLRPATTGTLACSLRAWADAGQAVAVTLAQLRTVTELPVDAPVHVAENPSVLAMALSRFGPGCPPLVCTSGWPNTVAIGLLRALRAPGLRYHGDLDGEGLRIAAYVLDKTGALPWRMTTADYLAAVGEQGPAAGRVTAAPWDPELAPALAARDIAVPEERVAGSLLDDLVG